MLERADWRFGVRRARWLAALALAGGLGACAMMEISHFDGQPDKACKTSLGHYFVPQSLIGVKVESNAYHERKIAVFGPIPKPDIRQTYCLDYLASLTSNDQVWVDRTNEGLLESMRSDADDQTHNIARTIIRTIFALVTGAPQTVSPAAEDPAVAMQTRREVFSAEYDPFDPAQIVSVNAALSKLGYCLVLERETFEGAVADQYGEFCDRPQAAMAKGVSYLQMPDTGPAERPPSDVRAVFYRPRLSYSLVLLEKPNLAARGGWELRKRAKVMLENASPLVALRVDRTVFAKRQTIVLFDNGALVNMVVNKGSEAAGFLSIPLELATAILEVPGQILKVRINQAANERVLVNGEKLLLEARRNYLNQMARSGGSGG